MAKRYLTLLFFLVFCTQLKAQQYGLFNTRTLFDAFENPAQKAFVLDSSRKYASNFLLPYFGLNAANKGDSNFTLRTLINDGVYNTSALPIGNNNRNKIYENSNLYLFTFRIFLSHKFNKELGFSWQLRSDAFADYTNEALVIFDDYNRFDKSQNGILNGNGYGQSYHQFSINYRENYNKRIAFGVKLSLLSGITYNKIDITQSNLTLDPLAETLQIGMTGNYRSNFFRAKELSKRTLFPDFKNPGLAVGFGTTYTAKSGVFIMGSIKDLGFIRWNNKSHVISVDEKVSLDRNTEANPTASNDLEEKLDELFIRNDQRKGFYAPTNAKTDFLISKRFGVYTPDFIISKSLFNRNGDIVLVNNFRYNDFSVSLSPAYNLYNFMMLGAQGMYQTPNFELFLGTDNLLRSAAIKQKANQNTGYTGASVYMGIGIKFGYVVEHPQNSSYMPGVGEEQETSFFSKVFGVFRKKK